MDLGLLRFLAQTFGASFTSAARPGLTFFAVQCFAAVMVRMDMAVLPEGLSWLVSFPAIGVAATMAVLELIAQHEEEVSEVLRELKIDHLLGAFGAFSATLMFAALGLPEEEAQALMGVSSAAGTDLVNAVEQTAQTEQSTQMQMGALGAAVSINLALTWVRGRIHEVLDEFDLKGIWQKIETGSVGGLLVVLIFLPLVALFMVAFLTVVLFVMGLLISRMQKWRDQNSRIACVHCQHMVRIEAHRCLACKGELIPSCNLGVPTTTTSQVSALKDALLNTPSAVPSS